MEFYFFQTRFLNATAKLFCFITVAEFFLQIYSQSGLVTIQFNVIYLKNKNKNLLKINNFQRRLAELVLSQFPRVLYIPPIHC